MTENEIIDDWMQKIAARSRDSFVQARTQGRNSPRKVVQAAGRFALIESDGSSPPLPRAHETHLPLVILRSKAPATRKYWPGSYDAEDVRPPACMSYDDIRPERNVPEPQSEFCATCEQNIWAVNPETGKRTPPRCRKQKVFAVFVPGHAGAWQFNIGPGSWAAWDEYVDAIENRSNNNLTLLTVVTEISFNRDPKKPNTLLFNPVGYIADKKLLDADDRTEFDRISEDDHTLARLLWGSKERENEFLSGPPEAPRLQTIAMKALPRSIIEGHEFGIPKPVTKTTEELINDTIPEAGTPPPPRSRRASRPPTIVEAPKAALVSSPTLAASNEGSPRFQELKKYFKIPDKPSD